ncbi:MAG: GNAT family N-acetyltransferase [Mesorhizobium sp.]|nr:MAG: GNAT family N-acetyltransferase [Mesorhizobium sp.]
MLYQDTVESEVLVHKPWFIAAMFAVVLAVFLMVNLTGTTFGELMRPVIGAPMQSGIYGRVAIAFVIAVMFCVNIVLIGFAPLKAQIGIVWIELLALFFSFFKAFNLSMPFIWENLPYLITQGVVTTIYVSAVSLICASLIAIIAAIAKLSSNGFAYAIANFYTSFFRGLPLLMQIYLIYLGLPQLGIVIDAVPSGILALSLCVGAYLNDKQIGFGRAITDGTVFAYLADVIVWPGHRGRGIGTRLVQSLINHPDCKTVTHWSLSTNDAHAVYEKLGFRPSTDGRYMRLDRIPAA